MSATGWMLCPKCKEPNPDSIGDPDSEHFGLLRIDFDWHCDKPKFELRFWCANDNCNFQHTFTEANFP